MSVTTTLPDPTTLTAPAKPSFPLTQNNLQHIFQYSTSSFGQISLTSLVSRPPGSHLCFITTHIPCPHATWSSIQTSETTHIELDSGLLYINHSCSPTVEIEVYPPDVHGKYPNGISGEVRVVSTRALQEGDEVTFFYPSTEWECPRPFRCLCGAGGGESGDGNREKRCIGTVRGGKFLDQATLQKYFVNQHILELAPEKSRH